jgi:MSHA biogenesis protein MshI
MDHFESQLRQPPIRSVLFRLDSPHSTTVKMQLSQLIPAQIDQLISPIQVSEDIDVYRLNLVSLSAAFCALVPQPIAPPTMSTTGELK